MDKIFKGKFSPNIDLEDKQEKLKVHVKYTRYLFFLFKHVYKCERKEDNTLQYVKVYKYVNTKYPQYIFISHFDKYAIQRYLTTDDPKTKLFYLMTDKRGEIDIDDIFKKVKKDKEVKECGNYIIESSIFNPNNFDSYFNWHMNMIFKLFNSFENISIHYHQHKANKMFQLAKQYAKNQDIQDKLLFDDITSKLGLNENCGLQDIEEKLSLMEQKNENLRNKNVALVLENEKIFRDYEVNLKTLEEHEDKSSKLDNEMINLRKELDRQRKENTRLTSIIDKLT